LLLFHILTSITIYSFVSLNNFIFIQGEESWNCCENLGLFNSQNMSFIVNTEIACYALLFSLEKEIKFSLVGEIHFEDLKNYNLLIFLHYKL